MKMTDAQKIMNYCKTRQLHFLKNLSRDHAVMFQRLSVRALACPKANHEIAREVLKYYMLDEKGRRIGLKDRGRSKAESIVNTLPVAVTGARKGDILVGASKGTRGAIMRVHNKGVPPQKRTLDTVRYYPELWEKLLVKLGAVPFFGGMNVSKREIWLDVNEMDDENSIGTEGARLQIVQPGTSIFTEKLSERELDTLVQGNPESEDGYWTHIEIENMIPRKTGSRAKRHTLILIRTFWKLAIDYEIANTYNGIVLDVHAGKVISGAKSGPIYVVGSVAKLYKKNAGGWTRPTGKGGVQSVGILVSEERVNFSRIDEIIKIIIPSLTPKKIARIRASMRNFTASAHKSLLQKIIRYRPSQVDIGRGKLRDARSVLLICMTELAKHPGAFVPDIQRYVTGMESFTKRVAVSIYEDSSVPEEMFPILFSMLAGSMLVQRVRTWLPSEELLIKWLHLGLLGLQQTMAYNVDYKGEVKKEPYVLRPDQHILKNASAVLDDLKSFPTDLGLARGWARDYPKIEEVKAHTTPQIMPISHCVDMHWAPQVAHYFEPKFVRKVSAVYSPSQPFRKLFGAIWDLSSSVNPRRKEYNFDEYDRDSDILNIRRAQQLFLIALQNKTYSRENTGQITKMSYTLNDAWVAGLVGAIEVKPPRHPAMLVTLRSDDPLQMVVIRRPSRNMTDEPLGAQAEEEAKVIAKQRLKAGVPMNKACAPDPTLKNAKLFLVEDYYAVQEEKGKLIPWERARKLKIVLPTHKELKDWDIKKALIRIGDGVQENAETELQLLIDSTGPQVVRRALVYLSTYNSTIEMNRISRDGGGTYKAVLLDDVDAYQFMLRVSTLYPAALSPKGPSKFIVKVGPLLWTVKNIIKKRMSEEVSKEELRGWQNVPFVDEERKIRDYQQEMVDDMIKNHLSGNKGNFIWVPVGLGKCLAPDTPVLMWDGSTKRAEDIISGDLLIGDDNCPRTVLSTCTGEDNMYRIVQNKGEDYIVNEPHILSLYNHECDKVIDIPVSEYLKLPERDRNVLRGIMVGVDFPSSLTEIDPYSIGLRIGNGHSDYIPKEYLINDRETRLKLLSGLIDGNGNGNGTRRLKGYKIELGSESLIRSVCYLIRSLGIHCVKRDNICYFRVPRFKKYRTTCIKVEPLGRGKYCGFTIDGNRRFLLGDFTVTHNTLAVLRYLQWRKENSSLPLYIVYTLPESAIKSIIKEIKYFRVPVNLIIPLSKIDQRASRYREPGVTVTQSCIPKPFAINLLEHDHLRRCEEELTAVAPNTIFVVDEVHKTLNDTKRTSVALQIAHLSRDFIVMTGTPIIDNNTYKLIGWLEQVVPYEVNSKNFWVAANSMIAKKINTGIKVLRKEIAAPFGLREEERYKNLVPPALGGNNVKPTVQEWMAAAEVCYASANHEMVKQTQKFINRGRGVMLVAKDRKHTLVLRDLVVKNTTVRGKDIYVMESGDSIFLTDEAVDAGEIHDYKVVIVPIKKAEGYTLTRLSVMITSVYPSNNATREQIEGRINRVSQKSSKIYYRTVHVGILTSILREHDKAKNLSIALQGLAKEIK